MYGTLYGTFVKVLICEHGAHSRLPRTEELIYGGSYSQLSWKGILEDWG